MSKKIFILTCIVMILTFNFTMSYAKANSWAAQFAEEVMPNAFAGIVTTMAAVGVAATNSQDYIREHGQEMYETAKATWPKMSADMQNNFRQSLSSMADGVVMAGDWITAVLDLLKPQLGGNAEIIDPDLFFSKSGVTFKNKKVKYTAINKSGQTFTYEAKSVFMEQFYSDGIVISGYFHYYPDGGKNMKDATVKAFYSYQANMSVANALAVVSAAGVQYTILNLDGSVVETNSTYNKIDEWLRDVAIPAGNLGVYAPAEAWTNKGYQLGLSEDGQQLLTLPDGVLYDPAIHGDYSWRKPLTQVIDGVPAVLNPTTWDWVNARDKTIVKPATIPEIAEYVGTDVETAEKIKEKTKEEGGTGTTGGLKNPTKKLIWTPLMMSGTAMTKKFPFSIPWDFANQLKVFNVDPEIPVIKVNIPDYVSIDGNTSSMNFEINFKMFDPIAVGIRWLLIIAFDIALILMLRRLLPE